MSQSYDLSDHDLLEREVKRLPFQAQLLFPIEVPFLKSHGVSDPCSLWDIGCGDGSWLQLFRSAFPNSVITGLDRSPEILGRARKQNPGGRFLVVDEKNISEVLLRGDFDVALLRFPCSTCRLASQCGYCQRFIPGRRRRESSPSIAMTIVSSLGPRRMQYMRCSTRRDVSRQRRAATGI